MKRNAVAWAALVVSLGALVGSRSYTKALPPAQDIPSSGQKVARDLSAAFNAVSEYVGPSVVQINVEKSSPRGTLRGRVPGRGGEGVQPMDPKELEEMLRRFFGPGVRPEDFHFEEQQFSASGTGSGFVYDEKGHILTNNHVVGGADKITVTFYDGVQVSGEVVGNYPEADIAVIKVDNTDYRPLKVGSSKELIVGEWVLAVGSPFGLSHTVTAGIISATQRDNVDINQFESFIQTDASINPGNSGGPLVNMDGRVIGINSAIATTTRANAGVGFAIPIDMAKRLADKLIQHGKIEPALMGIEINPLNRGLARSLGLDPKTQGVVVLNVGPNTPADRAGLKVGDIITSYDGEPVNSRKALQYLVQTSDVGKSYNMTYIRDGKEHQTKVSPEPYEDVAKVLIPEGSEGPAARPRAAKAEADFNAFGLAVSPLNDELAELHGWKGLRQEGLVITAIKPDGPAAAAGLEVGDLLTKVVADKTIKPLTSVKDFEVLVQESDELTVFVEDVNHRLPGEFRTLAKPEGGEKD